MTTTLQIEKEIPCVSHATNSTVGYGYVILHETLPLVLAICEKNINISTESSYFWAPLQPCKNKKSGIHLCECGETENCQRNRHPKMYPTEDINEVLLHSGDWYTPEQLQEYKNKRFDCIKKNTEISESRLFFEHRQKEHATLKYQYYIDTFCDPFAMIDNFKFQFHQRKKDENVSEGPIYTDLQYDQSSTNSPLFSFASTLHFDRILSGKFISSKGYRIGLVSFSPFDFKEYESSVGANNRVHTFTLEAIMDTHSWTGYFKNPGPYTQCDFLADPMSSKIDISFQSFEEMRDYILSKEKIGKNFVVIHLQNGILHSDTQDQKQLPALLRVCTDTDAWGTGMIGPDDYYIHGCMYFNMGLLSRTDVDENGYHLPAWIYINDNIPHRNRIEWYVDGIPHNLDPQRPSGIGYNWGWYYGTNICRVEVEHESYRQYNKLTCPTKKDGSLGFSYFEYDDEQDIICVSWSANEPYENDVKPYEFYNNESCAAIHPEEGPPPQMNLVVQYKKDPTVDFGVQGAFFRPPFPSDESFIHVPFLRNPNDSKVFSVLENISEADAKEFDMNQ